MKETARETAERVDESASDAVDGVRDYQLKMLSVLQDNINPLFLSMLRTP
jgi:hypothetical protein